MYGYNYGHGELPIKEICRAVAFKGNVPNNNQNNQNTALKD